MQLSHKLSEKYTVMAEFLTDNRLKVNDEKTHLLVMTTRQKRKHVETSSMTISTPSATVSPSAVERLLGAYIHEDMRWKEHIMANEDSFIKSLTKRQLAIKKISSMASLKSRKMIANGIFMSKLIYLMPVWAGCEDYLTKALQVIQNKVARSVTKRNIFTPTKTLMKECGWLTVKQLMVYHSLVQMQKTIQSQTPEYLYTRVSIQLSQLEALTTMRQGSMLVGDSGSYQGLRQQMDLSERSWCWRASSTYYTMPARIKVEPDLAKFKSELKTWVKETIDR